MPLLVLTGGGILDGPRGNMRSGPGRAGPPNQQFGGMPGPSRAPGGPMGGPGGRGMVSLILLYQFSTTAFIYNVAIILVL